MSLEAGSRLGPYVVEASIGGGGMGEVYRAKDTRIDRTVAIKVVASDMAGDSGFKERFEREARAVSSLNHPHICTIYEFDSQDGVDFLVMEYLEGETLAKHLERGPLTQDEALRHGVQIADALDKAHRQGIVHRDLKPGNVMLTPSGAKLLDFGLAKFDPAKQNVDLSELSALPTQGQPLTREGAILGTFQYMPPEQLEGRDADARTDIFAFGAILYEMLTGKKAFEGKSQAGLIGAILEREPTPISSARPATPPQLERVISKCLAKNPEERWASVHDLMDELRWIGEANTEPRTTPHARGPRIWLFAAAALLAGALVSAVVSWSLVPSPPRPMVMRFDIELPPTQSMLFDPRTTQLALAPDGSRCVYVTNEGLNIREMNESLPRVLVEGELGSISSPAFSPDSEWVAFWNQGELKKISVGGGAPLVVAEIEAPFSVNWAPDDVIRMARWNVGVWQVPANGGIPELAVEIAQDERVAGPIQMLPDGKTLLFAVRESMHWKVVAQSVDGGERRVITNGGPTVIYTSSGHLVFGSVLGDVVAAAFDPSRLELAQDVLPLIQDIDPFNFALSERGTLVSRPLEYSPIAATGAATGTLVWVDRQGGVTPVLDEEENVFSRPRLSPDGRRVAVEILDTISKDIWVYDLERGTRVRLTNTAGLDQDPIWTPDGSKIVFATTESGSSDLYQIASDGSGEAEPFPAIESNNEAHSFSPDGKILAYYQRAVGSDQNRDIGVMSLEGEPNRRLFLETAYNERSPAFSPDGRFIAYASDQSGEDEIYVQPFPGPGGRTIVSRGGGREPVWSHDGTELFYRRGNEIWAAPVTLGATFEAETPQKLFEGRFVRERAVSGSQTYDVAPDGRFILVQATARSSRLDVVVNWFEELNERVPTGR